jgi:hypothetical protein
MKRSKEWQLKLQPLPSNTTSDTLMVQTFS